MSKKNLVVALCVFSVLGLLASCVPADRATPVPAERSPFNVDIVGGDGTLVSLDGYSDGYRPGTIESMQLGVQNNTGQPWNGRVCVQLLEPVPSSVVIPLAQEDFDLSSGAGFEREIHGELPTGLAPGNYGLALVIQTPTGPATSVTTVHVGEGQRQPFHGEWPAAAAMEACPAR